MTTTQLLRTHPRYLSYGFLHFFFSAVGQTFFISLFVESISERMGWAAGTFAGIYSGLTLVAAFTLPVIGSFVDKVRVRYVSTATITALILGCCLVALSPSTVPLVLGLFICRLGGQGVLTLIGSTTIGRYFQRGRGKALSASLIGTPLSEVVLPLGAVALLGAYGYPTVWLAAASVLALVFLPAVWLLIRRHDAFQRADSVAEEQASAIDGPEEIRSWTRSEVLRDRRFHLLLPAFIFSPMVVTGVIFNQSLIAEARGFTLEWMAVGISAFGLARVICLLGAGEVADRFGPRRVLRIVHLPALIGVIIFLLFRGELVVPVFFALVGTTAGIESVLWPALWSEWYGPRFLGRIKGLLKVLVVLASAVAPVVFSVGLQWSLRGTFLLLGAYVLTVLLVNQLAPAHRRPKINA